MKAVFLCLVLSLPLIAQEPGALTALLQEVMKTVESGDVGAAITRLEREIRAAEAAGRAAAPEIQSLLGVLYLEANQSEKAYTVLRPLADRVADPGILYNAGRAAFAVGKHQEGEALFARSAELAPISPAARSLGLLRSQRGDLVGGYKLLRPWATQYPDDASARVAAAYLALELARPLEAEELLSDLPQDQPRVRILWGRLLLQKNDPHAAIAMVSPLVDPKERALPRELQADVHRIIAEAYLESGRADEALAHIRSVEPGGSADALLRARIHLAAGNAAAAAAILRPFAEPLGAPGSQWPAETAEEASQLVNVYGRALVGSGDSAEAISFLREVVKREKADLALWELLHEAVKTTNDAEKLKRVSDVVTGLRQADDAAASDVRLTAGDTTGKKLQEAQKWMRRGDSERALFLIRREAALGTSDLRPHFLEVQTLLAMKRLAEADQAADRTLQLAPSNADAAYQKGVVLMARGYLDEAEKMLRRALELAPDHTAAMSDLAVLLVTRKRTAEARELLERVLILRPGDRAAKANLEKLPKP